MKKDSHSKRLDSWVEYLQTGKRKRDALPDLPYPEFLGEKVRGVAKDWRSDMLGSLKEGADSFLFHKPSEPIQRAFDEFGLNPSNPFAWRLLIFVLAEVHFGTHKSLAGAPSKWTAKKWCDLLSDFSQMQARHPKASDEAICDRLKKDPEFRQQYSDFKAATIRRNLQYARDPEKNEILKIHAELVAEDSSIANTDLAASNQQQLKQDAVREALQNISTSWKRRRG